MNGFEIYLLRPNRTEEAVTIASRENAVIQLEEGYKERYQNLTEEEIHYCDNGAKRIYETKRTIC